MPKVTIKTDTQIMNMLEGGTLLAGILSEVENFAKAGVNTFEIDSLIDKRILENKGEASFKKVHGYSWASCVGLNSEVVHSIPKKDKILKAGDILKVDLGMFYKSLHTDLSWSWEVGEAGLGRFAQKRFLSKGEEALNRAIKEARPGKYIGHISSAIQKTIEEAGYSVVAVLNGHGVGESLHEDPLIP